jgi:hypothetical protein
MMAGTVGSPDKYYSDAEVRHWHGYHPPQTQEVIEAHEYIRAAFGALAVQMNNLLPEGEDKKEAQRKFREAMYAANACVAVAGDVFRPRS